MRIGLGRWQRWWCAGAAVLLAFLMVDAYRDMPTAARIRAIARDAAAAAQAAGPGDENPCQDKPMTQYDRSMCELKAESAPLLGGAASAAAIRQAAETEIREHLPGRQLEALRHAFVLWLAIAVAAYGAGWAVDRVIRRSRPASA